MAASAWEKARRAEQGYGRSLRRVASVIGEIVQMFRPRSPEAIRMVRRALEDYGRLLLPWSRAAAESMVQEVANRDAQAWKQAGVKLSRGLEELSQSAVGQARTRLVTEQVGLITSLPREAALRVQELAIRSTEQGARLDQLFDEIMRTGEVTESRARLIARTETGRAATALTQARATAIRSPGYIWRSVGDSDVRPSHKKMNGQFVAWDSPPTLDGMTGHAGTLPNCRCYAEPVIPD